MASYKNGMWPKSALVEVEPGVFLSVKGARAYRRTKIRFKRDAGKDIRGIDGYRSVAVQAAMKHAAGPNGTAAEREKWDLDPDSTVTLASPGYSPHGDAETCDILFGGGHPSAASVKMMLDNGWHETFGDEDPNHFTHDGRTGVTPVLVTTLKKYKLFPYGGTK